MSKLPIGLTTLKPMHRNSKRIATLTLILCAAAGLVIGQEGTQLDVQKCWEAAVSDGRAVISDGASLFVSRSSGRVDAFGLDGRKVWTADLGGEVSSNAVATTSGLVIATNGGGSSTLRSLSKETGVVQWNYRLPEASEHSLAFVRSNLIAVSNNGSIQSLDPANGNLKWKREIASAFAGPAVFVDDKVLVASATKQLFVLSALTGEIDTMLKREYLSTAFAIVGGSLVIGDERGNVSSTPFGSEKPTWKFKTGGKVSMVRPVGGDLLVSSFDNFVYFVNPENGSVRWKRRLTGRAVSVGVVDGKYILSAATEDHAAALNDLISGKVAGQVGLAADEVVVSDPVLAKGRIVLLTSWGMRGASLTSCGKKESGPGL